MTIGWSRRRALARSRSTRPEAVGVRHLQVAGDDSTGAAARASPGPRGRRGRRRTSPRHPASAAARLRAPAESSTTSTRRASVDSASSRQIANACSSRSVRPRPRRGARVDRRAGETTDLSNASNREQLDHQRHRRPDAIHDQRAAIAQDERPAAPRGAGAAIRSARRSAGSSRVPTTIGRFRFGRVDQTRAPTAQRGGAREPDVADRHQTTSTGSEEASRHRRSAVACSSEARSRGGGDAAPNTASRID